MKRAVIGLRSQIVMYIAVLMLASTALIGYIVIKVTEQAYIEQRIQNAMSVLRLFQEGLKTDAASPNQSGRMTKWVMNAVSGMGGHTIYMTDSSLRITASSSGTGIDETLQDEDAVSAATWGREIIETKEGVVTITLPRRIGKEIVGIIRILSPIADIEETSLRFQRLILFYVILTSVIIAAFFSFLLSRTVVKPIEGLLRVTEAVSGGNLNQQIRIERHNEIGVLAESFNRMTDSLRKSQEELQENIRSLKAAHDEIKKAQEEVIRSEKMASVGRLAAGIAHEIGNPLGAILGYLELLRQDLSGENDLEHIRRIEAEMQRINRIVRGLLDYARPKQNIIDIMDIGLVITATLELVSAQKDFAGIEVENIHRELPPVKADPDQLQQVLINLFINAADAMGGSGKLTIETGVMSADRGWVIISVSDTGSGIEESELKKIFDPFYTTKEPGKGTGLGLSVSQRIIESFGGRIEARSGIGKGSTFMVILPAAAL